MAQDSKGAQEPAPPKVDTTVREAGENSVTSPAILALGEGVATEWGGVLYLVNLMAALDLPACFEHGWRLASAVGPWGLLEALGRELIGIDAAAEGDGLWAALAHLDGRDFGQPPGVRLPRRRPRRWPEFEAPVEWLAGIPEAVLAHAVPPPARRIPPRSLRSARPPARYPPLLARWLVQAMSLIELRLRLALDLGADASLGETLLRLPGRLYVSRTHVDLVASLDDISLPARLAGLDRDPGWLPDFGRVIYFHFE
jgi:hypothetical protein